MSWFVRSPARPWLGVWCVLALSGCLGDRAGTPAHGPRPVPAASTPASTSIGDPESPYRGIDDLPEGTILHVPTGVSLTRAQLLDLVDGARVVYVGEAHDNLNHHRIQLDILTAMAERYPGRVAVGMEMFQRPAQGELDRWSHGDVDEHAFLETWYENWTEDYDYYRDILRVIRDRHLPLLALNASQATARTLAAKGMDGLTTEERASLPDIDTTDPFHRRQMEAVFGSHAQGAGFDAFYRAMLLWDETMADTVAGYLAAPAHRDTRLIVFAGGGHIAYGFGIPRRAFRRLPVPYLTILPHTDIGHAPKDRPDAVMMVEPVAIPLPVADVVWVTGYEGLGPPAVKLGVRIESRGPGVAVTSVEPDSPAAKAGIREGDVIVEFDGDPVHKPGDVVRRVRAHAPGDHARLAVMRGEDTLTLDVSWPP